MIYGDMGARRTVAGQNVENPERTFGFRDTAGILNAFVYPEWSSRITQLLYSS